jgi:putative transposase
MPRIARIVVPKYPHHITQRGTNKSEIFIDNDDRLYFLKLLNEWLVKTKSELWAYCLMNNHFHLLIAPDSSDGLGKCLHGATFQYAQYFNNKYRRRGRFWENRYFSCPVDKDEYLWAVVKYIEMNPVRAKISQYPEEWRWSSAQKHSKGRDNGDAKLYTWLEEQYRKEYAKMIVEEAMQEKIRKATSAGRPLFKENFLDKLEKMLNRPLKPKNGGRPSRKGVRQ